MSKFRTSVLAGLRTIYFLMLFIVLYYPSISLIFVFADMQCHCYVCDLPAPCLKWGTGISSTDHCHATEKAEMWKIQRKNFKRRNSAPLTVSTNNGNSLRMEHPQHNQVLPLGISQFSSSCISQNQASRLTTMRACPSNNSIPIMRACSTSLNSTIQNQVSSANTIPICSATTNFTVPNGTNHSRCQESVSTSIRNRYQPYLVSRQLLGVRSNTSQRDRRRGSNSLSPQLYGHHMMSNRLGGIGGTLTLNHSAHGSFSYGSHVNPVEQHDTYHYAAGNGWHNGCLPTNLPSYQYTSSVQPSLNLIDESIVASEIQAYSQPTPLENRLNFYQSCIQGNDVAANYVAWLSGNQHGSEHQIRSQIGNAGGDTIQCGNSRQEASRQEPQPVEENQGKTSRNGAFSVLDIIWNENTSQNIEPLIESSRLQSTASINQPPNVKESDTVFAGSTYLSSLVDFENWLMEKDGALPSESNISMPDSIPVADTGTLFCDFDTSLDGLAHSLTKN